MSAKAPALADFRRIVVKVGSSLLVDAERRPAEGGVARFARRRHRAAAQGQARHHRGLVRRDRARPLGAQAAEGPAQARRQPGRRRRRPDRAGPHLGRGAGQARHHREPDSGHARRHRGAPALSQRALDHRQAAGVALGPGDQRERHRGDHRNPLRRQRPPCRPRRHHGERRPAGAAVRHRRPLRRAAASQCQGQAHPAGAAHQRRDRGDGGRRRVRSFARRHAHQDRGRQDRHHRRHPHGDRLRPRRQSAAGDRGRRARHLVSRAGQSGHLAQEMDRRLARAQGHADHRRRRRRGASAARACCRPA